MAYLTVHYPPINWSLLRRSLVKIQLKSTIPILYVTKKGHYGVITREGKLIRKVIVQLYAVTMIEYNHQ